MRTARGPQGGIENIVPGHGGYSSLNHWCHVLIPKSAPGPESSPHRNEHDIHHLNSSTACHEEHPFLDVWIASRAKLGNLGTEICADPLKNPAKSVGPSRVPADFFGRNRGQKNPLTEYKLEAGNHGTQKHTHFLHRSP